jgi:hypothetical protein
MHITIQEIVATVGGISGLIVGLKLLWQNAKKVLSISLQEQFNKVDKRLDCLEQKIEKVEEIGITNTRNGIRNEILIMINTQPEKVDEIERAFERYRESGGNGYIDNLIKAWREEYEDKIIKDRLKKERKKNG